MRTGFFSTGRDAPDSAPRYEEKKGGDGCRNVFPSDVEIIPAFSVLEIMISAANQGGFDQGYGLQVSVSKIDGDVLFVG